MSVSGTVATPRPLFYTEEDFQRLEFYAGPTEAVMLLADSAVLYTRDVMVLLRMSRGTIRNRINDGSLKVHRKRHGNRPYFTGYDLKAYWRTEHPDSIAEWQWKCYQKRRRATGQ